jgi:hypothetical protein
VVPLWPWSYDSWIYNYLLNQCISPLVLWVRISIRTRCTTLCDKVCQWLATGRWFSLGPPDSSTNKSDRHDITEILLKVALNTIKQTNKHKSKVLLPHGYVTSADLAILLNPFGLLAHKTFGIIWLSNLSTYKGPSSLHNK